MADGILDARLPWPRGDTLLRIASVEARVGLKKSEIYRRIKLGEFPRQIAVSEGVRSWFERDIDAWIDCYRRCETLAEARVEQRRLAAGIGSARSYQPISPGAISPGRPPTAKETVEMPIGSSTTPCVAPATKAKARVDQRSAPQTARKMVKRPTLAVSSPPRKPTPPQANRERRIRTSRQTAAAFGARFYRGKVCSLGHRGDRYVSTGACLDCVRSLGAARRGKTLAPGALEIAESIFPGPISPGGEQRHNQMKSSKDTVSSVFEDLFVISAGFC